MLKEDMNSGGGSGGGGGGGRSWARTCDSCRAAACTVYCRYDSAYLCTGCDARIHAANQVASRHERVWVCEACERAPAAFTCKADAASLCTTCDADIHSANPLARRHHRVPILPITGCLYGPSATNTGGLVRPGIEDRFTAKQADEEVDASVLTVVALPTMDLLQPFLPEAKGILPYYMIVLSVISIGNSLQAYTTLHFSRRLYNGRFVRNPKLPARTSTFEPEDSTNKLVPAQNDPKATDQLNPLAGRLFGTWTLISCIVRCYAAYNLHIGPVYTIAYWTYIIALSHFASELFVFKSMTLGLPQIFPFTLATLSLIWMPMVRDYYVTIN